MDHARERGAARIDLNTSEDDVAARALYESAGFTNREGGPDGPTMLYYERDLSRAGPDQLADGLPADSIEVVPAALIAFSVC
jgi:hypothetical protein